MATIQQINIGANPNDHTGDTPRDAFGKVNDNFTEVVKEFDSVYQKSETYSKDETNDLLDNKADLNGNSTENFEVKNGTTAKHAVNLEQLSNVAEFATLYGAHEYSDQFKTKWHGKTNSHPGVFEIIGGSADNYTSIKIKQDGIYRIEAMQRGVGGGYGGATDPWIQAVVEGWTLGGVFGLAPDEGVLSTFSITTRLPVDAVLTAGVNSANADMKWSDEMSDAMFTVTRIGL